MMARRRVGKDSSSGFCESYDALEHSSCPGFTEGYCATQCLSYAGWRRNSGCVRVTTPAGTYTADVVLLAAGRGTPELAAQARARVRLADKPPTLNVYTASIPPLLRHIILSGAHACMHVPCFCYQACIPFRSTGPYTRQCEKRSLLADALFLRQARDGSILISVYKEALAQELLPSPAAAQDPAALSAAGQQVSAAPFRTCQPLHDDCMQGSIVHAP
jgi:glycine/D-amino acid oxidase-like deaminating enzyme